MYFAVASFCNGNYDQAAVALDTQLRSKFPPLVMKQTPDLSQKIKIIVF